MLFQQKHSNRILLSIQYRLYLSILEYVTKCIAIVEIRISVQLGI